MPLVLAMNEDSESGIAYDDRPFVSYEYPARYRNRVRTGEHFVYYRGRRRAGGGRQPQVYLGAGRIGQIRPSSRAGHLVCEIVDGEPFEPPVLFKDEDGTPLEPGGVRRGYYQQGVRVISPEVFEEITRRAHVGNRDQSEPSLVDASSQRRAKAWLRDELILALELYKRYGSSPPAAELESLSQLLRALPIEPELAEDSAFRSSAAVKRKLGNFVALDTGGSHGLPHGGRGDGEVWREFADSPAELASATDAIRANVKTISPLAAGEYEPEIADAPEGRLVTRVHRVRERDPRLVRSKKQQAMAENGTLRCEVCDFDFERTYGSRGAGFIECHHVVPVSSLRKGQRTRLEDLRLVCPNCHRMIHRKAPWLSIDELRQRLRPTE